MNDTHFKKAFDIGEIPDDIDLNSPPVTGFDYLYRVRLETRKCPKVVVSNIDTTQFLARQTVQVEICNGFIRARPGFSPDPGWAREQLETFCSLRSKMSRDKGLIKEKFPKKDCPKITKEEEWCKFCLGSAIQQKLFGSEDALVQPPKCKKSKLSEEATTPMTLSQRDKIDGHLPLLSILLHLNQSKVTQLLSYHVGWLEQSGDFTDSQGKWIYSLLACLEKPLDPDTCALLRTLSRLCSKYRDDLDNAENPKLNPLNLILCIVAQFFDQKDMSDGFLDSTKE